MRVQTKEDERVAEGVRRRIDAAPVIRAGIEKGLGWEDIVVKLRNRGIDFGDKGRYVRDRVLGRAR